MLWLGTKQAKTVTCYTHKHTQTHTWARNIFRCFLLRFNHFMNWAQMNYHPEETTAIFVKKKCVKHIYKVKQSNRIQYYHYLHEPQSRWLNHPSTVETVILKAQAVVEMMSYDNGSISWPCFYSFSVSILQFFKCKILTCSDSYSL